MNELISVVWSERRVLEQLLFKMVVAKLMLSRGDPHHITIATSEVDHVVDALGRREADRIEAMSRVAGDLGQHPRVVTLAWLAAHGPMHLRPEFADHCDAFTDLIGEIQAIATMNRQLAVVGLEGVRSTLEIESPVTYDAAGRQDRSATATGRVERVI